MNYPIFHPGEEAIVGPYAYDRRMIGAVCTIDSLKEPIGGEYRYVVSTRSGLCAIVLERTLVKLFERCGSDWETLKKSWQPRREAR